MQQAIDTLPSFVLASQEVVDIEALLDAKYRPLYEQLVSEGGRIHGRVEQLQRQYAFDLDQYRAVFNSLVDQLKGGLSAQKEQVVCECDTKRNEYRNLGHEHFLRVLVIKGFPHQSLSRCRHEYDDFDTYRIDIPIWRVVVQLK